MQISLVILQGGAQHTHHDQTTNTWATHTMHFLTGLPNSFIAYSPTYTRNTSISIHGAPSRTHHTKLQPSHKAHA